MATITEQAPVQAVAPSHGDDDPPRYRHIIRMAEQGFDMTIVTLCGIRSTGKPSSGTREPCPKCVAIRDGISQLDRL